MTHTKLTVTFRLESLIPNITNIGVIPYCCLDGRIYLLLGQEHRSKKLTSFEGMRNREENILNAALRVLMDGTRGIFKTFGAPDPKTLTIDNIKFSPVLPAESQPIIFVEVDGGWRSLARDRFLAEKLDGQRPTNFSGRGDLMGDVRWISINNFEKLITGEKNGMKTSLKDVLIQAGQGTIKTGLVTLAREE